MKKSVVMFHIGRSGSRVVGKLLDQHSEIDWQGEALKRPSVEAFSSNLDDPSAYCTFDHLEALSAQRSATWLGVETKFFHLAQRDVAIDDFVKRTESMGCEHFIVLVRKNMLRKIVSSMVAKQSRSYHRAADEKAKLTQITIDPDCVEIDAQAKPLVKFLEDYQQDFDQLDACLAGKQVLALSYEEHVSDDPRNAYGEICQFLNIPSEMPEVPFGKTNPFPLSEIIQNWEEIVEVLAETKFAWMSQPEQSG